MTPSIHSVIRDIAAILEPHYESQMHAYTVAWWIIEALTKKTRGQLLAGSWTPLTSSQTQQLEQWLHAHTHEHYPLQYLLGCVPFGPLEILVEAPTLIPRPETEEWCARLVAHLEPLADRPLRILDMCTGSGCIALWLAHALPNAEVYGVDISPKAINLAQRNATHNGVTNVQFLQSDLFDQVASHLSFDLIVSNPPYINPDVWHELSPTVARWEDQVALVAPEQGLAIIKKLVRIAPQFLSKQSTITHYGVPRLVIEIGFDQGNSVRALFIESGFVTVRVLPDSADRDRVVSGW